ncbi:MAG TPA: glycosaminoglycan attachment protein [Desulfotomaculum sp.]|nr:MAG: glycosaminoglycan attachment protein [Desulfotomaculum sp. BICA1-6]HBX23571.1 glycosaminoglycan attachment protein [Desulfotomaculum sp.]
MEPVVKTLDKNRFNALSGLSRSPAASYISEELGWYSNEDETVIGVVLRDIIDNDFAGVILAQDEGGRFRAFDVKSSLINEEEARNWLQRAIKLHTSAGVRIYPQGDETRGPDLFTPLLPPERLHPNFIHLVNDTTLLPAREIICRMMPHYCDVDGNFVEQFQSTGFDARLWELYNFAYISEEELYLVRNHTAPDFLVSKYGKTVAIEAVIVGRKKDNPPKYFKPLRQKSPEEILEAHKDMIPIRFGSPLYTKLKKRYWDLTHVKGNPLVFAIADFHDDQSMLWTSTALINYLYGVRHEFYYDENGQLVILPIKIDTHKVGEKEIPSGFFNQPEAEHVSAILFSASGTISKFNRIGRQAGFYDPAVIMIRLGMCHNHDPNAALPIEFKYIVDENCNETWAEGLSMYHNPNAIYPVPEELFPSIAHHHFQEGQIVSHLPEFHPYASVTINIRKRLE